MDKAHPVGAVVRWLRGIKIRRGLKEGVLAFPAVIRALLEMVGIAAEGDLDAPMVTGQNRLEADPILRG